jgi:RNA polymerase sigma-70 factor (ECF subfamily)
MIQAFAMPDAAQSPVPAPSLDELVAEAESLYRYAVVRVRDHHLAEDLVQDTLLTAVRKFDEFQGRSALGTWLVGILRHKILDHFRAAARKREEAALSLPSDNDCDPTEEWFTGYGAWKVDPNAGLEVLDEDPRRLLERAEVLRALRACLDRLPSSLRRLYVLRELDGSPPEEICETTGVTRGSLAVLLHRARQLLRACLQRTWLSP